MGDSETGGSVPWARRCTSTITALTRLAIGVGSASLALAWLLPAAPVILNEEGSPVEAAAPTNEDAAVQSGVRRLDAREGALAVASDSPAAIALDPSATDETPAPADPARGWKVDTTGRTVTDMGCADDLSAEGLDRFFAAQKSPIVGWDNPHIYPIDERRSLWIAHDTYVDYSGSARNLFDAKPQMQNVVFLQQDECFTLVHGGTPADYWNFELGDGGDPPNRFFWPLGGHLDGSRMWIFWAETVSTGKAEIPGDGILRYPIKTWLASYDIETLERLSFEPAPNSGTFPTYGFAVESDDQYSYLFANSNLLNFTLEGGYANGPHSATKMYVGRVPLGQLDQQPEYWDGSGWSDNPLAAAAISERFWAENTMQPRYLNGKWISVVKRDGFFGNEIVIDVAENAWGPWIAAERIPYESAPAEVAKNSYHPVIAPWSSPENGLILVVSENAQNWIEAVERLDLYRPRVIRTDWPESTLG